MSIRKSGQVSRRSADRISRQLELEIIAGKLPPGTFLGSEADLMARFGAARGVVREAVTLLESHMMAHTKRGVGGGLVVAEADPTVVEGIVSLYLARDGATEVELLEVRLALEVMAMREALDRLDDDGRALLQAEREYRPSPDEDIAAAGQRLHNLLARLSGNTVLRLFIPTLTGLVEELWDLPGEVEAEERRADYWAGICTWHDQIIDRMLAGETEAAVDVLTRHLRQVTDGLATRARLVQARPH